MIQIVSIFIFVFIILVKSDDAQFEFGLKDRSELCSLDLSNVTSEKCANQLQESCKNGTVLFELFDASSKFPYAGIAAATRGDWGNFDQCLHIDHGYSEGRILGKYCYPGLVLPDFDNLTNTNFDDFYKLSICMPDECSAADYNSIFGKVFSGKFPGTFSDINCATKESGKNFDATDIITLLIICVCLILMLFSTMYDVYLHKKQQKSIHPLLLAFSVYTNGLKILQTSEGTKEQIQVFHGLKTISMFWIISGHGFVAWNNYTAANRQDIVQFQKTLRAFYITSAPLAVDTFFFIAGFLLAYQYLKTKSKPLLVQIKSIPHMIVHRYLRLTPAVLMLYLVSISILSHLGTGPLWSQGTTRISEECQDNWWPFFLYIQNYYTYPNEPCLVHTWYLSADMQMFLLSPLVIIPVAVLLKDTTNLKKCMVGLLCLNSFFTALPLAIKLIYRDYNNSYDTHSRLINYSIGMTMGIFIRERKDKPFLYNKVKRPSVVNLVIWTIILLGMLTTTICYQEVERNHGYESKVIFYSLMRPAWCIGLSWIVYSSYHGYGGFVNWFLSRPIFQVLGKLSYCMYLVHGLVITYFVLTTRTRLYFGDIPEFYNWCAFVIISTGVAFFWSLAFESPLMIIEKFLLGGQNKKKGNTQTPA